MPKKFVVRLKPYNPKRGCFLRKFVYQGMVFEAGKGWYEPPPEAVSYLRMVRQKAHDETSQLAFDVHLKDEAQALVEKERLAALAEARPEQPIRVTRVGAKKTTTEIIEPAPAVMIEEEPTPVIPAKPPGAPRGRRRRKSE